MVFLPGVLVDGDGTIPIGGFGSGSKPDGIRSVGIFVKYAPPLSIGWVASSDGTDEPGGGDGTVPIGDWTVDEEDAFVAAALAELSDVLMPATKLVKNAPNSTVESLPSRFVSKLRTMAFASSLPCDTDEMGVVIGLLGRNVVTRSGCKDGACA